MGKLTDLLKNNGTVKKETRVKKVFAQMTPVNALSTNVETAENTDLSAYLTPDEYEQVKSSVVEIDSNGKNRREIIIGMFGMIKNPKTGKRFAIPSLSWDDEDYAYQYAKYMKTLVYRPDEFKKVLDWE